MVRLIVTEDFRTACAVLARAKAYVGHESGLHHAAAAVGVPGVVIFGGYTPIEVTGYPMHRNLGASMEDACGSRQPCDHCAAWMERITPEQVLAELKSVIG
jgi:ADP-heptose:LPS heptosyltransferase